MTMAPSVWADAGDGQKKAKKNENLVRCTVDTDEASSVMSWYGVGGNRGTSQKEIKCWALGVQSGS